MGWLLLKPSAQKRRPPCAPQPRLAGKRSVLLGIQHRVLRSEAGFSRAGRNKNPSRPVKILGRPHLLCRNLSLLSPRHQREKRRRRKLSRRSLSKLIRALTHTENQWNNHNAAPSSTIYRRRRQDIRPSDRKAIFLFVGRRRGYFHNVCLFSALVCDCAWSAYSRVCSFARLFKN